MKMKYNIWIKCLLISFLAFTLCSCYEDEKFSDDPNLQLTFSSENIPFDTIFANVQSPVKVLKIYNGNNHSITIDSIYLDDNPNSDFMLNVNGRPGTSLREVEVLRKDSIYVFVAVRSKGKLTSAYQEGSDKIVFKWNGNLKQVSVSALQRQIDTAESLIVSSDTTITRDCYLKGITRIEKAGILHISEGVTLFMDEGTYIDVNGTLTLDGTLNKPVVLRGSKMNYAADGVLNDNHTEQWGGIVINTTSSNNIFRYATIKNATQAIKIENNDSQDTKLLMYSSVIHNSLDFGIRGFNAKVGIYNSRISNSYGPLIQLLGGEVELVQNTIANYFQWYTRTSSPSLVLNSKVDAQEYPFTNIILANNLIVGRKKTEFELNVISDNLTFTNNLIQVAAIPEYQGTDNYWNIESPFVFENLNDNKKYFYSFALTKRSNTDVLSNAVVLFSSPFPLDISGYARPTISKADIGCYQHRW